jgi:hypothetical protein
MMFYLNLFNNVGIVCCSWWWWDEIKLNLFIQLLIDFFNKKTLLNKIWLSYYMKFYRMFPPPVNTILILSLLQMPLIVFKKDICKRGNHRNQDDSKLSTRQWTLSLVVNYQHNEKIISKSKQLINLIKIR